VHSLRDRIDPRTCTVAQFLRGTEERISKYVLLGPGGQHGVVDCYVSAPRTLPGERRHGPLIRWFWPRWFAHDGVRLDPAHLRRLRELVPAHLCRERLAPVPYLPGLRVPYYVFLGQPSCERPGAGGPIG
jgi:S-adenosylmethionine-diacylgycerolhomoserine-N-methlytransferase